MTTTTSSLLCGCTVCVAARAEDRARIDDDNLLAELTAAPVQTEMDFVGPAKPLSKKQQQTKDLADRLINVIPDDEVTKLGPTTVIWNKPRHEGKLLSGTWSGIMRDYETMDTLKAYYGEDSSSFRRYKEDRITAKAWAYPGKRVLLDGWHECSGSYKYLKFDAKTLTILKVDEHEVNRTSFSLSINLNGIRARLDGRPRMSPSHSLAYKNWLNRQVYSHTGDYDAYEARATRISEYRNTRSPVGAVYKGYPYSGVDSYAAARAANRAIGAIVARPSEHTFEGLVAACDDMAYGILAKVAQRWNERTGDTYAQVACGHWTQEGERHLTNHGSVCIDCYESNYVDVVGRAIRHHRDGVYRHEDGLYYTHREGYGEDNVQSYTTNVLDFMRKDDSIIVAPYADVLMGIELEVYPVDGRQQLSASKTQKSICPGYAILKNDGSLPNGGFEIVTAPRGLVEHVKRFGEWEPHHNLRSWDGGKCGMHVHLTSAAFTQATFGKFLEFINATENDALITDIAGRHANSDRGAAMYCQRDGEVPYALGNPKKLAAGKSTERYRMVNTCNLRADECERLGISPGGANRRGYNTIELRIFRGTLNKNRLLAQIEFAHAALMFCRWSSMRQLRREHFISWLQMSAPMYPNLAKWFGVRSNTKKVDASPKVRETEEV